MDDQGKAIIIGVLVLFVGCIGTAAALGGPWVAAFAAVLGITGVILLSKF